MVLYAIHDALVKPMPGVAMASSLAESWNASADGLVYEFVLRKGVRFHNGDPVTSDDVKFSFERYKGAAAPVLKAHVAAVEIVDAQRIRFRLKQPWPDFMAYYGTTATGSGWIVPKKYVEKVGDEGFRKAPVGAGPYKFVSFTPGVELVVEAFDQYWRKVPSVKRLVLKVVPDETTRFATLKRGDADVAYAMRGALAEGVRGTAGLTLKPTPVSAVFWVAFLDQWDPKSPWHDRRVRLAANYAIDRYAMNQAEYLGFAKSPGASYLSASSSSGSHLRIHTIPTRRTPARGTWRGRLTRRSSANRWPAGGTRRHPGRPAPEAPARAARDWRGTPRRASARRPAVGARPASPRPPALRQRCAWRRRAD